MKYFRETAGAVASAINLRGIEKNDADWVQAVAGGQLVLKDAGGTTVTIENAGGGQIFRGPWTQIISSAGKIRYGTGEAPSQSDTASVSAANSATAAANSATAAATSATSAATSATSAANSANSATGAATSAAAAAASANTSRGQAATSESNAATSATAAAASAAAATFTYLSVTLIDGEKTQSSGANLGSAHLVGAPRLTALNASTKIADQVLASISGNNVILTAYSSDPSLGVETGDVSTYEVAISGAA